MKLASFQHAGHASYGVVEGDHYLQPPADFLGRFPDLASVLRASALAELQGAVRTGAQRVPAAGTRALPVLPAPGKFICVGLNYKTHVAEMKRDDSKYPALFVRFNDSLAANGDTVLRPSF